MEQFNHIKPDNADAQVQQYQLLASAAVVLLSPFPSHAPHTLGTAFEGGLAARAGGFFLPNIQNAEFLKGQGTQSFPGPDPTEGTS